MPGTTSSRPSDLRILLVEDDEHMAGFVQLLLSKGGYEATWLANPAEAVEELENHPYDVVISDYYMPRMNGLQVLRRARLAAPDSIRILLTSAREFDVAAEAINRGEVYRYMTKPVEERELLITLRHAAERLAMARELAELREELKRRDGALQRLEGQR